MVSRALGWPGYGEDLRSRVVADDSATARETAAKYHVSESTVSRWRALVRQKGSVKRRDHGGGRECKANDDQLLLMLWLLSVFPVAKGDELAAFASGAGPALTVDNVYKELNHRLGVSRKQIQYYSKRRDENQRVAWWTNTPGQVPHGVFGLPTASMVWFDEASVYLCASNRRYGRSFVGTRATMAGWPRQLGARYTVVVAVDTRVGCVARLVFAGSMNKAIWISWLALVVFPALAGTGPRTLIWDNLNAHLGNDVDIVCAAAGHLNMNSPTHSPDFNPSELTFKRMRGDLQDHQPVIVDAASLLQQIHASLDRRTGADVASDAVHSFYHVPGRGYHPYM